MKWSQFEEQYLTEKVEASGKRPGTVKSIKLALKHFKEMCKPKWGHQIDKMTP